LARFAVVGATNSIITSAAFYALAFVLPAKLAFTFVYLAGLTFVVVVTPKFVFGTHASMSRRLLLALWYLCVYATGIGVISLLENEIKLSRIGVVIGTVIITAPLGFVGGRLLVGRPG
jgi:putative flippase GtrA